jgi:hypothetical protein
MSMKPTAGKLGDSLPANSAEEARVIPVDKDSDGKPLPPGSPKDIPFVAPRF